MRGYILELLAGRSWSRTGQTYWTQQDAELEAQRILRRGKAVEIRILTVEVAGEAAITLTSAREEGVRMGSTPATPSHDSPSPHDITAEPWETRQGVRDAK